MVTNYPAAQLAVLLVGSLATVLAAWRLERRAAARHAALLKALTPTVPARQSPVVQIAAKAPPDHSAAYADVLHACLARQPHHEREHREKHAHGHAFTRALRVEVLANRLAREIDRAGLPALPADERRRLAKEALCRSRT